MATGATHQVLVIFDNGTERVMPSVVLLPEDATFGDAVGRVNASHAAGLWKVAAVELAGFVREKDFQNRQAMVLRAGETQRLSDVLSSDCFLVFRAAAFAATDGNGGGTKGEEAGDDAEALTNEDQIQSAAGRKRVSREAEVLAEQWGRRPKRVSVAPRPYSPQIGVPDKDWQTDTVQGLPNKQRNRKSSSIGNSGKCVPNSQSMAKKVHRPTPQRAQTYAVGTRHFLYCDKDGIEYPVRIKNSPQKSHLKPDERMITFEGYRGTHKVKTSELLPVTTERETTLKRNKNIRAESDREERERKKEAEAKRKEERQRQRERENAVKERRAKEAEESQKQHEKELYGERTSCHNLPVSLLPGALEQQQTRRVYFAEDDETPVDIARKFGVSVDKVIYDNCVALPSLKKKSRLEPLTPIVLPLKDVARTESSTEAEGSTDDEILSSKHCSSSEQHGGSSDDGLCENIASRKHPEDD